MKERPIIFSAPMVRAILAGTKTQSRRVIKEPGEARVFGRHSIPEHHHADGPGGLAGPKEMYLHWAYGGGDMAGDMCKARVYSPYGPPGDRLWVRETWRPVVCGRKDCAKHANGIEYRATAEIMAMNPIWKSPIYMKRAASRLTLEIDRVRVERLQNITEDDARAEGVPRDDEPCDHVRRSCSEIGCLGPGYRASFCERWDEINGKRAPWSANPWVFVLTFRRVA